MKTGCAPDWREQDN